MNDRPDARELLAIARETFTSAIMPILPEALRYTGLMIANALAIVQRESEAGDGPDREEFERLRMLLSEAPTPLIVADLRARLESCNRRFAKEIRAGRFDDGQKRISMFEHLSQTTADKLAVSNPKALIRK